MIFRTVFIFLLLLASVYLGVQLHKDPGYLLIVVDHWTIETTLWVAIIFLILTMVLLHLFLLSWHKIAYLPTSWRRWRASKRAQKAQEKTTQGLIEFSEGHWRAAQKHLINALPDAETPLLNYLTAARAAQALGNHQLRDDYLRQAQQSMPEAKVAVELTQAQLQLANQQWEQALATLKHLQDLTPNHPYVLKLLVNLYQEVRDWPHLIALLPTLKREKILASQEYQSIEQQSYTELLLDHIKQQDTAAIEQLMQSLPKSIANDGTIIREYGHYLLSQHQDKTAEQLLRRSLQREFHESVVDLYGQIKSEEVRLEFAESLLKHHAHSAKVHLAIGRIAITKQLWGKAKAHSIESIQLTPTPTAYEALGKLYEQLNDEKSACQTYREGLNCLVNTTIHV